MSEHGRDSAGRAHAGRLALVVPPVGTWASHISGSKEQVSGCMGFRDKAICYGSSSYSHGPVKASAASLHQSALARQAAPLPENSR